MAEPISEEDQRLLAAFKELKVKPKTDTPQDLQAWIKEYGHTLEEVKPAATAAGTPPITVSTSQPRLPIFYGDTDTLTKGECTYDQWIYEVKSLMTEKNYKSEVITQAIRRSLRGDAFKILMRLAPGSDVKAIVEKFESVYGLVESRATLLSKFYGARQKESENTTQWTCRLEDLLNKLIERKLVDTKDTNEMLCDMFWTGLRQDLKDVTGYKFEQIKDFDKLRVEVRKIEQEHSTDSKNCHTASGTSKSAVEINDHNKTEIDELRQMMKTMDSTVTGIGEKLEDICGTINRPQLPPENRSTRSYTERNQKQDRTSQNRYNHEPRQHQQSYRQTILRDMTANQDMINSLIDKTTPRDMTVTIDTISSLIVETTLQDKTDTKVIEGMTDRHLPGPMLNVSDVDS